MSRTDCLAMILEDDIAEQEQVGWRLESGILDSNNPMIEPKYPWDSGATFSHGTFALDPIDGLWKAWYISTPMGVEEFESSRRLTYATSEDGVNWTRPELDLCPQPDYPRTNILFDLDSGGLSMYPSVFIDPEAEAERRYEMLVMRSPGRPEGRGEPFVPGIPRLPGATSHPFGTYRYFSSDGIHWNPVEGPLLETMLPGQRMTLPYSNPFASSDNAWYYRDEDGVYLLYQKVCENLNPGARVPYDINFTYGRRVIARRTSADGSQWSPLEVILQPDWQDPQDLQFMELCPAPVRGGYLGILPCYNVLNQTIDIQLAGSADGRIWHRPVRLPAIPVAPLGDYGGGMIWPTHHLIESDDRHYLYYGALEGLHGDRTASHPTLWTFHGAICRASWEVNRYWAAVSGAGGNWTATLTTHPLDVGGRRLVLNAATSTVSAGSLEVELCGPEGKPIPGFSRSDYVPWHGDSKEQGVRWSGGDTCPRDGVAARFYIQRARLYGFAWE